MAKRRTRHRGPRPGKRKRAADVRHPTRGGVSTWRLADRGPLRTYDEYSGEDVELELGQSDPGQIAGLVIDFRYRASDGETTRRSLLCWQCGRDNDRIYVRGYCPFREELRTFRIDRMYDVIVLSGERDLPIDDVKAFFAAFAADETEEHDARRLAPPDP